MVEMEIRNKLSFGFVVLIFVAGMIAGGILAGYITLQEINKLNLEVSSLNSRVSKLWGFQNISNQNITIYQNSTTLSEIYEKVKDSVVLILGKSSEGSVQGSGFVYGF
jgi:outer membrane murein-binding lipoprotein Lpp